MSTAYVKQTVLPYRGEPTRRRKIDIERATFLTLHEQKMGDDMRQIIRKRKETESKPHRGWSEEEIQLMVELREKGLSFSEIGKRLNRSKGNVHSKFKQAKGEE